MIACDTSSDAQFFAYNQSLLQLRTGDRCLESAS